MNATKLMVCLLIGLLLTGCGRKGGSGGSASTNLSVVVWSSFPPTTNSYRHSEHLQQLQHRANALIATNSAIFNQPQARGKLAGNSPLRSLLSIPSNEPATISWSQTVDHRFITVRSSTSQQRLGRIKLNLKTGLIESRGQGYLTIDVLSFTNSLDHIARVGYPSDDNLFSAFGLSSPGYRFGGLSLSPAWTNLNTQGFQIDSDGYPYPKAQ
jgi:hypothetical protein